MNVSGQLRAPAALPPPPQEKASDNHWTGSWEGGGGAEPVWELRRRILHCRESNSGRPARTRRYIYWDIPIPIIEWNENVARMRDMRNADILSGELWKDERQ
jgi:hypothetical protein